MGHPDFPELGSSTAAPRRVHPDFANMPEITEPKPIDVLLAEPTARRVHPDFAGGGAGRGPVLRLPSAVHPDFANMPEITAPEPRPIDVLLAEPTARRAIETARDATRRALGVLPKDRARELLLAIAKEDPETRITDLPELERHSRGVQDFLAGSARVAGLAKRIGDPSLLEELKQTQTGSGTEGIGGRAPRTTTGSKLIGGALEALGKAPESALTALDLPHRLVRFLAAGGEDITVEQFTSGVRRAAARHNPAAMALLFMGRASGGVAGAGIGASLAPTAALWAYVARDERPSWDNVWKLVLESGESGADMAMILGTDPLSFISLFPRGEIPAAISSAKRVMRAKGISEDVIQQTIPRH